MTDADSQLDRLPIGAVVQTLQAEFPDVSHSSLRFLEREGLVVPTRTAGGHRLYAPDDLRRLRQIKTWQSQRLALADIRERLERLDQLLARSAPHDLAAHFLERVLAGDLTVARRALLDASDTGLDVQTIFDEVLRPAMSALGDCWERGDATVAQEKEGSELARELITELVSRQLTGEVLEDVGSVVAACVAGEQHELGLRMVSGVLRTRQVSVHYLGANVTTAFLLDAVQRRQPRAVLLSATLDEHLPALRDALKAVRSSPHSGPIWAGGQAVERQPDTVVEWGAAVAIGNLRSVDQLLSALRAGSEEEPTHAHLGRSA
jgi:methanogenic corrinoid protein MtbC1